VQTDNQTALAEQFPAFVATTQRRLLQAAGNILRAPADAEDVVNEGYLRLWQAVQNGEAIRCPAGWLLAVVRRLAIDALRRRRRTAAAPVPDALPGRGPGPADLAESRIDLANYLAVAAVACGAQAVEIFRRIKGEGAAAEVVAREFGIPRRAAYHATERVTRYLRRCRRRRAPGPAARTWCYRTPR
jgi:RNA polymerase sigma factor (sigma-70 family)